MSEPRTLLVIAGSEDAITPVEGARAIAESAPDARLLELAGAPHVGQRDADDDKRVEDAEAAFATETLR